MGGLWEGLCQSFTLEPAEAQFIPGLLTAISSEGPHPHEVLVDTARQETLVLHHHYPKGAPL